MRTTLTLPEDVYEVAKSVATQRHLSLGDALALLVRGNLREAAQIDTDKDFPCFALSENTKPITMQHTLEIEDEW